MTDQSGPGDEDAARAAMRASGRQMQNARREAGLTQKRVADTITVTPATVRNWEAGRHEPPPRARERLAELYGTTVPSLMGWDENCHITGRAPFSRVEADPQRLRLGRHRASLSQENAAERSGISRATLGRYERGSIRPTRANLETLATLYGRPTRWFVPRIRTRPGSPPRPDIPGLQEDDVVDAYRAAQPDLPDKAVRSIADYIRFLHQREMQP